MERKPWRGGIKFKILTFMCGLVSARLCEIIEISIFAGTELWLIKMAFLYVDVSGSRCISAGRKKDCKVIC